MVLEKVPKILLRFVNLFWKALWWWLPFSSEFVAQIWKLTNLPTPFDGSEEQNKCAFINFTKNVILIRFSFFLLNQEGLEIKVPYDTGIFSDWSRIKCRASLRGIQFFATKVPYFNVCRPHQISHWKYPRCNILICDANYLYYCHSNIILLVL